jgi:hypothetical protein
MKKLNRELVDLYAGGELTEELEAHLVEQAQSDPELLEEMQSLRAVVDLLHEDRGPVFGEESFQRVLMKMHSAGCEVEPNSPEPAYWQHHLPMTG